MTRSAACPETTRLRLRELTLLDADNLFDVFADDYAREFYPQMIDRSKIRDWIHWNLENYENHGFGLWAVESKVSGKLIGDCGLTYQDVDGEPQLEIGYHIIDSERRNGYATEAARACLDFGFHNTAAALICSIVRPANAASCTVAGRVHSEHCTFLRHGRPALLYFTQRSEWGFSRL